MNSPAQFLTPPVTGSADLNISRLDADVGDGHSAFLQHILDSSTEYSVIGKDLEGKIVLWNEGARRLYGYEPEEVVGKANSVILHTPEDVAAGKPAEILEVALRAGKWEGIITRLRKNGQRFTARVVITPRRVATGRAIGFLLISKDISDEIQQQVLQESEERFRTMANLFRSLRVSPTLTVTSAGSTGAGTSKREPRPSKWKGGVGRACTIRSWRIRTTRLQSRNWPRDLPEPTHFQVT
jgi:PAS domain S-box-containing protein